MTNERVGQYEESIEATLRQLQVWVRAHRAARLGIPLEPATVISVKPARRGSTCELWLLMAFLVGAVGAIVIPIAIERGWIDVAATQATSEHRPAVRSNR